MKLFQAIRKSDCNAAIYHDHARNWAWVVVAWPYSEYSIESHSYRDDGEMKTLVATFDKFTSDILQLRLGKETYGSNEWEPYNATIVQQQNFGRIKSGNVRNTDAIRNKKSHRTTTRNTDISGTESEDLFGIRF